MTGPAPGPAPSRHEVRVVVAVEQLRRRVPGGIGRYARGLLRGLAELDVPGVELLASRTPGAGDDPLAGLGFALVTSRLPAPLLARAWDLGLAAAPRGVRVVHAVSLAFPPVRPPKARGGAALCVTVHDLAWRRHPDATTPRGRRWHEAALRRALARADGFVVPSEATALSLVGAGASAASVRVVAHGVDHLPAPDEQGAAALLERLDVRDGYLLAAATLEPRKNLARLVAAYGRARPELAAPWPLVVVGPAGWGGGGGLPAGAPGVVLAGEVDDAVLAALYGGARAVAYVPLAEGFGLPPIEAMACGAPVVTSTAVPSTAPPSGGEAAALRVDPLDEDAIAEALVRVSGDEALRAELAARGAEQARSLTWARAARAHLEFWDELA